jgi:pimeloyl-[acyl-carrier protein] methyl ester esterase
MRHRAIVLPGLDGTGALLDDFAASLALHVDVTVIAYPPCEPMGYAQLCDFVRKQLPDDDFILVAESFSGPIAIALASEPPRGLKGLVLCASFARVDIPAKAWLARLASLVPAHAIPAAWLSVPTWGRWRTRGRTRTLMHALSQVAPAVLRTRALEALSVDMTGGQALSIPVLCLQAQRDVLIRRSAASGLASRAPDLQVLSFDAPHFLLQVRPQECASAIEAFVRELARDEASPSGRNQATA